MAVEEAVSSVSWARGLMEFGDVRTRQGTPTCERLLVSRGGRKKDSASP